MVYCVLRTELEIMYTEYLNKQKMQHVFDIIWNRETGINFFNCLPSRWKFVCWKNRQESGIDTQVVSGTAIYVAHVYSNMAIKLMNMHETQLI